MLRGEEVTFSVRGVTGVDSEGNDLFGVTVVTVPDALVAPGDFRDVDSMDRPSGDVSDLTIYVRSRGTALAGVRLSGAVATVTRLSGRRFSVIGSPAPYPPQLVPTPWDTVVHVKEVTG